MAASRIPGPIGRDGRVADIDDGTMVRNLSPTPGACGRQCTPHLDQTPHQYPIVELLHSEQETADVVDRRLGQADLARTAVQAITGSRALRNYNWLTNIVGANASGNFRGMVISAKWRAAFQYTSHVGKYMENAGYFASLAAGIVESAPQIGRIADSQDSISLKGMKMAAMAGSIAERALLGVIPAGAHLIYRSLEGWCQIAGLAGGKLQYGALQCISTLRYADILVQTSFKTVTDTSNQSKAVWVVIDNLAIGGGPRNR